MTFEKVHSPPFFYPVDLALVGHLHHHHHPIDGSIEGRCGEELNGIDWIGLEILEWIIYRLQLSPIIYYHYRDREMGW